MRLRVYNIAPRSGFYPATSVYCTGHAGKTSAAENVRTTGSKTKRDPGGGRGYADHRRRHTSFSRPTPRPEALPRRGRGGRGWTAKGTRGRTKPTARPVPRTQTNRSRAHSRTYALWLRLHCIHRSTLTRCVCVCICDVYHLRDQHNTRNCVKGQ